MGILSGGSAAYNWAVVGALLFTDTINYKKLMQGRKNVYTLFCPCFIDLISHTGLCIFLPALLPGVKLIRVTDIGFMHNPLVSDDFLSLNVLWISNMLKLKLSRPTYAYGIWVYCAVGFPYLLK